jgi:uncharacterized protein (DUF1501 family)
MVNTPAEFVAELQAVTRRQFLGRAAWGLGGVALASMLAAEKPVRADGEGGLADPLAVRPPHFAARAKRVIFIHLAGAPSQHELFDWKPALVRHNGSPCPQEFLEGEKFAFIKGHPTLLGTPYRFARHGRSGQELSELLPNLATVADELCIVKSCTTDQFNHAPAQLLLHTGEPRFGGASMGSWLTYGLGTEASELPGFVVLVSGDKTPDAGKSVWGSGFLPGAFQGVQCRASGDPVLYVRDPQGIDRAARRRMLDALRDLNSLATPGALDPETDARIAQYELAYRMQASVPEAMDISRESTDTLEAYGATPGRASFANNCLLARRLSERGVRFVQLFDWGWDAHGTSASDDILTQLPKKCAESDRPVAALIRDLRQRGLLDETLIVWGGEFGRTPMAEFRDGKKDFFGRDHHPHCFTVLMAGGGSNAGTTYGETDELGCRVVRDAVPVKDLQATILHLMGLDHRALSYTHAGLPRHLTGVSPDARVHRGLIR